jgi:hypothetical protein
MAKNSKQSINKSYGNVTFASEGLQNRFILALRAFEQGDIFIVQHLLLLNFSGLIQKTTPFHCLFRYDHKNGGPVSHVKELSLLKVVSTKHRSKFAALSPMKVTAARWLKICSCTNNDKLWTGNLV